MLLLTKSTILATFLLLCSDSTFALPSTDRTLSLGLIAGYEPQSTVTDHNALDLDQRDMEVQLDAFTDAGFAAAELIYTTGGHSKSYADLALSAALTQEIPEGAEITGVAADGAIVTGEAYETAKVDETTLKFRYAVSSNQESYSECHVGGLSETNTAGCLAANGTLASAGIASIAYTYTVETNNKNGRTLQGFSTNANVKMRVDEDKAMAKPYYADFQKFVNYYGTHDYSDQLINAAFRKESVTLNGKTFDWGAYDLKPRAEVVAKGSAYISVAMYVIRELEDAIDDCVAGDANRNADLVQALDEAVAFYTGSLEGTDSSSIEGKFVYALAKKRCANFKTCGETGDQIEGNAKVNIDVFSHFSKMQTNLVNKKCDAARLDKEAIAKKLFVPMIQGTIRYAYLQTQPDADAIGEAEGAIFAAAVLPIVAECSAEDAATILEEMGANSGNKADLGKVKEAFENNYGCMGITCADVGGVYDKDNAKYFDGAAPCGSSKKSKAGLAIGLSIGGVALLAIAAMVFLRKGKSTPEFKGSSDSHV